MAKFGDGKSVNRQGSAGSPKTQKLQSSGKPGGRTNPKNTPQDKRGQHVSGQGGSGSTVGSARGFRKGG